MYACIEACEVSQADHGLHSNGCLFLIILQHSHRLVTPYISLGRPINTLPAEDISCQSLEKLNSRDCSSCCLDIAKGHYHIRITLSANHDAEEGHT